MSTIATDGSWWMVNGRWMQSPSPQSPRPPFPLSLIQPMIPAKTPTEASGFKALLTNRPFLFLWTGQIVSQIADKVLLVMSIALLTSYNVPI
ncbi:MAG: hypothetical protein LH474_04595, partial [Chamaesiphon sp.]|nr:hypothetical protein [Chamaesiphon sp.]